VVIDSYLGSVPNAAFSLFEVNFTCNNTVQFFSTTCFLQIYPNKLWNNTLYSTIWRLDNKINGNANYAYSDATYAPNGRWYFTYNQQFSNYGGPSNAWLVPQIDKVNIIFGLPNSTTTWTWEAYVRCLDATPLTDASVGSWNLRTSFISNW
jgi:hypothetical protein